MEKQEIDEWYESAWEKYWKNTLNVAKDAIWDEKKSLNNLPPNLLNSNTLPILDLGCGTGHYTNLLSKVNPNVIGVDISNQVIESAKNNYPNLDFRKINIFNQSELASLLEEFEAFNIHCRGVLHQIDPSDRELFLNKAIEISNKNGYIFLNEMSIDFKMHLSEVYKTYTNTPKFIKEMLIGNYFLPHAIDQAETIQLFKKSGYELTDQGEGKLSILVNKQTGEKLHFPSTCLMFSPLK